MSEIVKSVAQSVEELDFSVHTSIRYHGSRRAFFEKLDILSKAFSAMTGSAAFVALLGNSNGIALGAAAIVAVTQTLDLAIGFSSRARRYDDLYRRFSYLAASISEIGADSATKDDYRRWKTERLKIESDEPTPLDALNVICHNAEAQARGLEHEMYKISKLQTFLCQLFSFATHKFELINEKQAP